MVYRRDTGTVQFIAWQILNVFDAIHVSTLCIRLLKVFDLCVPAVHIGALFHHSDRLLRLRSSIGGPVFPGLYSLGLLRRSLIAVVISASSIQHINMLWVAATADAGWPHQLDGISHVVWSVFVIIEPVICCNVSPGILTWINVALTMLKSGLLTEIGPIFE